MSDPYANVRAAFREVTLGLMSWQDPPLMGRRSATRKRWRVSSPSAHARGQCCANAQRYSTLDERGTLVI